jgi:hypothetical protein
MTTSELISLFSVSRPIKILLCEGWGWWSFSNGNLQDFLPEMKSPKLEEITILKHIFSESNRFVGFYAKPPLGQNGDCLCLFHTNDFDSIQTNLPVSYYLANARLEVEPYQKAPSGCRPILGSNVQGVAGFGLIAVVS